MAWKDYRKKVAVGLWVLVCILFAPSVHHLATYGPQVSETLVCYPEYNPEYSEEGYEQLEKEFAEQLRSNLSNSPNPDAQLMALLVSSNGRVDAANIDQLAPLYNRYPESGLIASQLLTACSSNPGNVLCGENLDQIAVNHFDNAAVLAALALYKYSTEDSFGAKTSLRSAARAPFYDDYWKDQIRMLHDFNPANSNLALLSTVFYFFNYTDTTIGLRTQAYITSLCSEWSADDPLMVEACTDYGQKVIDESQTILGARLGYAIQEETQRSIGNQSRASELEQESRRFRYSIPSVDGLLSLMTYDESLAEYWLQTLVSFGEIEAQEIMVSEVNRRMANPEYRPCDQPGLRFDFPFFYFGEERVKW